MFLTWIRPQPSRSKRRPIQFCFDLEYFIQKNNPTHYNKYGLKYLQEILADLYGITKTELFLNDYPDLYNQNKDNLILQKQTRIINQINRLKYLITILKLKQINKISTNDTKPKSK